MSLMARHIQTNVFYTLKVHHKLFFNSYWTLAVTIKVANEPPQKALGVKPGTANSNMQLVKRSEPTYTSNL